jgi:hypothetical protein
MALSFTPDPRAALARLRQRELAGRSLTPIQPRANPYAKSPWADAAQQLAYAVSGKWAGEDARRIEAEQQAAQAAVLGNIHALGQPRTGPHFREIQTPIPGMPLVSGGVQTRVEPIPVEVDDEGRSIPPVSAETATEAGIPPIQLKILQDRARLEGDKATEAAIRKEAIAGLRAAVQDKNLPVARQYQAILEPEKALITQEKAEQRALERREKEEETEAERADKRQVAGRKLLDVYDNKEERNVKILRSAYDADPNRYGPKSSEAALSRSWVNVTRESTDGKKRTESLRLTDDEIVELQGQGGVTVGKAFSPMRRYRDLGVYVNSSGGPITFNGRIVEQGGVLGEGTYDRSEGLRFIREIIDGEIVDTPIPPGAEPRTESSLSLHIRGATAFAKLRAQIIDDEVELRSYARYMKEQKNTDIGWKRLVNELSAFWKVFVAENAETLNLTPEEVAQRVAQGQLQGLIGRARISTVGGGVMTEKDAWRVITNLGGKVDAFQNPDVVKIQISRLYNDKARSYANRLEDYNIAIDQRYGAVGYKPRDNFLEEVDPNLFVGSVDLRAKGKTDVDFKNMTLGEVKEIVRSMGGTEGLSSADLDAYIAVLERLSAEQ